MARMRSYAGEVLIGIIACLLALMIDNAGAKVMELAPAIENSLSPVVAISALYDQRDQGKVCFFLDLKKEAAAKPLGYDFFAQTRVAKNARWGPPLAVSAYLVKDGSTEREPNTLLETHPVGATWRRHYCFELPGTIADWQTIRVTGEAQHRRHPGWTSITPVPEFYVPSLKGDAKL